MSQKKSWDDIPSLDNLEIDWDYEPENPEGKRAYVRLESSELKTVFNEDEDEIVVRIATNKRQFQGNLQDISQGGAAILLKRASLEEGQLIKIGFFLGREKITSKARIRNLRKQDGQTIIGVEFVGLPDEKNNFIANLYSTIKIG